MPAPINLPPRATTEALNTLDGNWLDTALGWATGNRALLCIALALTAAALIAAGRKIRNIAKSERPDEPLSNLVMLVGLGWSSEAVWEITGRLHFPTGLRLFLFFVLESLLALAMIRAKRNMRDHSYPGRSGRTAWIVAASMALVAATVAASFAEAALRVVIPLLVTNQWWDGLVGEGTDRVKSPSSWRWTPRRLLLWLGAIEPGDTDFESVNRERLTQQMTRLEYRRRYGREKARESCAAKLARLSLTADDAIIAEVRQRVSRASWFTTMPLTQRPADLSQATADGLTDAGSDGALTRRQGASKAKVQTPPMRRVKPSTRALTSGDASDADPATQAARLFLTRQVDSIREAARQVKGASEATTRRRVNEARDAAADAAPELGDADADAAVVTQIQEPRPPVFAGVNGHTYPTTEATA